MRQQELPYTAAAQFDRPTGRGITLMRTIMDEVRYNDAGNEVTLVKHCAPEPDEAVTDEAPDAC